MGGDGPGGKIVGDHDAAVQPVKAAARYLTCEPGNQLPLFEHSGWQNRAVSDT